MAGYDDTSVVNAVAASMLVLSWIAVSLRTYVRVWMVKSYGLDDYFAIATLATFTLFCIFVFVGMSYRPTAQDSLSLAQVEGALKWWWAATLPYIVSTILIKFTVGLFLLRFCTQKTQRWAIYILLTVFSVYGVAYLFICFFQCLPVGYFWLQVQGQKGTCLSRHLLADLSMTAAALNAAGDIALGIVPITIVRNLKMNFRVKVSVAAIMAIGSVSCFSTLIRLPYLVTLLDTKKFLDRTSPVVVWALIEVGLGLFAASCVALKPLFKVWLSESRRYRSRSRGGSRRMHSDAHHCSEPKTKISNLKTDSETELAVVSRSVG